MKNEALKKLTPQQLGDYMSILNEQGKSVDEIKAELYESGLTEDDFNAAMATPKYQMPQAAGSTAAATTNNGLSKITWGAGLLFLGIVISVASYNRAAASGGSYVITIGLMAGGVVRLISGFVEYAQRD